MSSANTTSAPAAAAAAAAAAPADNPNRPTPSEETIVLAYLRRYGLSDAASELSQIIQKEATAADKKGSGGTISNSGNKNKRKRDAAADSTEDDGKKKLPPIDYDVNEDSMDLVSEPPSASGGGGGEGSSDSKPQNTLTAATGGGFGYDLDAAPTIALWGAGSAPPSLRNKKISELLLEGRHSDAKEEGGGGDKDKMQTDENEAKDKEELEAMVNFRDEARRYIEGFTSLVTWILTLPDDPANPIVSHMTAGRPPFSSKSGGSDSGASGEQHDETTTDKEEEQSGKKETQNKGLANLVKHALSAVEQYDTTKPKPPTPNTLSLPLGATAAISSLDNNNSNNSLLLPPSSKPELLSLSFPLLVHTYCELLTCGLHHTAHALLDTYRHLYEPMHANEISDLDQCNSTKRIVQLNEDVIQQSVVHSEMRLFNGQMAVINKKMSEIETEVSTLTNISKRSGDDDKALAEATKKLSKCKEGIAKQKAKVDELNGKNDSLTKKLLALPFLRRARALKWNITISTSSFGALAGFVQSRDELLPMSALLQSRCHLIVERRDPLPFCPPAVLADVGGVDVSKEEKDNVEGKKVRWAAPLHPVARAIEAGEDVSNSGVIGSEPHHKLAQSILTHSEALPFPKMRFEEGDDDKDAKTRAAVEFNRALLVNGFRRLEALELKQEYEAGLLSKDKLKNQQAVQVADPLQPSVLLATICSSSSPPSSEADAGAGPTPAPWLEPNVGITSASICPPDGRKVAVGCDDAAVRIWSLDRSSKSKTAAANQDLSTGSTLGDPSMVLLGHKNGFPVFDVDWTRNGRTLLSAGGDGTVRLWDTQAVGPYGKVSNVLAQKNSTSHTVGGPASTSLSTPVVPGSKAESLVQVSGAALSVYRGHAPSTPVWSVSSAPCGYYFASAGSDYTARIWTTDRTSPVRVLSGHVSPSVNCVTWHPNCNYVLTASDDKTCRMFDIQTGKCVRLLNGSSRGLNMVRVSPSGRYAAGSGYDGVVRIWDLGNGRMINELRPNAGMGSSYSEGMIQSMSFSSCGAALAVAGEDCTVRVWDVRGAGNHLSNPDYFAATRGATATSSFSNGLSGAMTKSQLERMPMNERSRPGTRVPTKVFSTNNVSVLDLKFTKRNLLLAVGNY